MSNQYQTTNSFTQKPSIAQIVGYIVFISSAVIFYVCVVPQFRNKIILIVMASTYSITLLVLVISTLISSVIDPSDEVMVNYRNGNRQAISQQLSQCLYCDYCRSYVRSTSRHCRACNRCVQQFDHHCMWINNCVGKRNYKFFAFMIVSTWLNLFMFIVGVVIISIQYYWLEFLVKIIFAWAISVVVIILGILLFNLILLHIYLTAIGMTTYQFIMVQRQQQKQKEKKQEQQQLKKKQIQKKQKKSQVKIKPSTLQQRENSNTQIKPVKLVQIKKTEEKENVRSIKKQFDEQNIFGERQVTEKSDGQVQKNQKDNSAKKQDSDSEKSSIKISQFFMKNKSFKLLVDSQKADRPNRSHMQGLNEGQDSISVPNKSSIPNTSQKIQMKKYYSKR